MAYSTPLTAVASSALTAAQWNASVRDNLLETAVAKATTAGRFTVNTGANALAERVPSAGYIATSETTAGTGYTNLATVGPDTLAVTTGPLALVLWDAVISNNTVNAEAFVSLVIGGATTLAANDNATLRHTSATANAGVGAGFAYLFSVTPGSNDFRLQYRVSSGTGTFVHRRITTIPF